MSVNTSNTTREDLRAQFERLYVEFVNGTASDAWVMVILRDWREDLPPWERWAIWERWADACRRLDYVRSDMWDPATGDREQVEADADADAETALTDLIGGAA